MFHAVDMHCDTISRLWLRRQAGNPGKLRENELHIDLNKMKAGGYLLQNFAMFVLMEKVKDPLLNVLELIDEYERQLEENRDLIAPVYVYEDVERNRLHGKMSALLTVEEGGVCKGSLEALRCLYRLGVRMMTLTWNFENEIGFPHVAPQWADYDPRKSYGLKPRGIEFVREMDRIGGLLGRGEVHEGALCGLPLQRQSRLRPLPKSHRRDDSRPCGQGGRHGH